MQIPIDPITEHTALIALLAWIGKMVYEVVRSELRSRREPAANETNRQYDSLSNQIEILSRNYTELRTMLIGINGNNGMYGEIRGIRDRVHVMEGNLGMNVGVASAVAEQLKELRRRLDQIDTRH